MRTPARLDSIAPLIETLLECRDPVLRDRVLVEAACACLGARAVALWRPIGRGSEPASWRSVIARGAADELPRACEIEAVVGGVLSGDLGEGRRVLACDDGARSWALSITGPVDEDDLDLVDSMLSVARRIEDAEPAGIDVQGALPRRSDDGETRRLRHDLRNLLTTVQTAFDYAKHFGAELEEAEARIVDAALDRDLSRVGRLFAGALDPDRRDAETWSPRELIRDVVHSSRAKFAKVGLCLSEGRVEDVAPTERLSELAFRRILDNLVCNAFEALIGDPDGSVVTIDWGVDSKDPERAVLGVQNDGPGLPAPGGSLFDEGVSLGKEAGSGLGLAVVRELALAAGGSVRAESTPPRGARFEVCFPREGHGNSPAG